MKSSSSSWGYGILMTLLLAVLAGVGWLTLSGELPASPTQPAQVTLTRAVEPVAIQAAALVTNPVSVTEPVINTATATAAILPAPTETTAPSLTPTPLPTETDLPPTATATITPKPTNTATPQPTATATATPLTLPLPTPALALSAEADWQPYVADELVYLVAADRRGFVWLGNETGMRQQSAGNDAIRWQFSREELGVGTGGAHTIFGDGNGGLWVGGEGASFFNGLLWRTFTISDGLTTGTIQAITEDGQGRIWLGANAGLSIWGGGAFFTLNRAAGLPNDDILTLLSDGDLMWIGTNGGGLFRFENNKMQIFSAESVGLLSDTITALGRLGKGQLLVGSDRGLMIFDGEKVTPITDIPSDRITAIASTGDGDAWVGTDGSGLHHLTNGQWTRVLDNANLPDATIVSLTLDRYGALWVVRQNGKVVRHFPAQG